MFRNALFIKHSRLYDIWFISQNKVFCFLSGPFLRRTRFMRVIWVGFTSKCSKAIFLGNPGSHAILKVLLAWTPYSSIYSSWLKQQFSLRRSKWGLSWIRIDKQLKGTQWKGNVAGQSVNSLHAVSGPG